MVHRPGTQHTNADALSRLTPECTPVSEGICEDDHDHVRQLNDQLKYVYSKCLGPPITPMEGYDHLIHKPFKIGDNVLVKIISPLKLETKYNGPCLVIKVLDYDTYVISEKGKEVFEHHSGLKLFRPNEQLNNMDRYMDQYDL